MFQQRTTPTHTASLSETQLGQFAGGASRGSTDSPSTIRLLANLENGRTISQGSRGLENGLSIGHPEPVGPSEANDKSFQPQNVSRSRTDNNQTLTHRPKAPITRSKTTYEPHNISFTTETNAEEHGELRHGWEDEYNSSEFLGQLNSVYISKHRVVSR